jgi:hypothetical protein
MLLDEVVLEQERRNFALHLDPRHVVRGRNHRGGA